MPEALTLLAEALVGIVFLASSVHKLGSLKDFVHDVERFELLPLRAVRPFAIALPVVEFGVGLLLLLRVSPAVGDGLAGLLLFHLLTRRLSELGEAVREFESGNRSRRAPAHRRDEIGQLAGSFNSMADTLDALDLAKSLDLSVLHDVPGLTYRTPDGVQRTADRDRIEDLNSIPSPILMGLFEEFGSVRSHSIRLAMSWRGLMISSTPATANRSMPPLNLAIVDGV